MSEPKVEIYTVKKLLTEKKLAIPVYQRPYKWATDHIDKLWEDLKAFDSCDNYRLGTVVLHKNSYKDGAGPTKNKFDIVDGQQRIISLLLFVRAALANIETKNNLGDSWSTEDELFDPEFRRASADVSLGNIKKNYEHIKNRLIKPADAAGRLEFLANRCEFVVVKLNELSEAFQFFDAQNSRGKDLYPHDLLKAYHLRCFDKDEKSKKDVVEGFVEGWEAHSEAQLNQLFSNYLFYIKRSYQRKTIRPFKKEDIDTFKGVTIKQLEQAGKISGFLGVWQLAVNQYRNCLSKFPYQLDQPIIDGELFFYWIEHYQNLYQTIRFEDTENTKVKKNEDILAIIKDNKIIEGLNDYKNRGRTGDRYVRNMFDCLLMFYIDRFGMQSLEDAITKIFEWAYYIRLSQDRVSIIGINKYIQEQGDANLFSVLRNATTSQEFLRTKFSEKLKLSEKLKKDSNEDDKLLKLFKKYSNIKVIK